MFTAYALIKNLDSRSNVLQFNEFSLRKIQQGRRRELEAARELFPYSRVTFGDWVYEKSYQQAPPVAPHQHDIGFGRIPSETEDLLLLLRLFKAGDLCFSSQAIRDHDGRVNPQYPYWAMADIVSTFPYTIEQAECAAFDAFAFEIPQYGSWQSTWFQTARRFFLSGGAKEFNLHWDLVDRIVDYATALEAVLSTEMDYLRRQLSMRGTRLLGHDGPNEDTRLIKRFYDLRSTIAHGSQRSPA